MRFGGESIVRPETGTGTNEVGEAEEGVLRYKKIAVAGTSGGGGKLGKFPPKLKYQKLYPSTNISLQPAPNNPPITPQSKDMRGRPQL